MCPKKIATILFALSLSMAYACSDDTPGEISGASDADDADGGLNTDLFAPSDSEDSDDDNSAPVEDSAPTADPDTSEPSDYLGRFDECGFTGPECEPPLQCLGTCQLPCSAGCPGDEVCVELSEFGAEGVCGVVVGEGEDCDFSQGTFCEDGLFCSRDGVCERPSVSGEGASCGGFGEQCEEGLVCVATGFGEGICHIACSQPEDCDPGEVCIPPTFGGGSAACYEDCDPPTDTDCSDNVNYECREPIGGGDAACLPRLGEAPGDGAFGEPCDSENRCQEGLFCPGIGGGYCTKTCSDTDLCPTEPAGAECLSFGIGFGLCAFTCPGGTAEECPEGMDCTDLFGQSICAWP